jgi:hypothetical protein
MAVAVGGALGLWLDLLDNVRRSGDGWMARCKAHEDRHNSLSMRVGEEGRVLLHCFAGCSTEEVVAAYGRSMADLFDADESPPPASRRPTKLKTTGADAVGFAEDLDERLQRRLLEVRGWTPDVIERVGIGWDGERVTVPYVSAAGELVGLGRYAPNPERRNGSKMLADPGSRRELVPPPETVRGGTWMFVCEGEADSIRLLSCGLAAVGVPGVQGWRAEWASRFAGRRVCITFDCDTPGREAAARVARDLREAGVEVAVLDLDPDRDDGFDVTDFTASARTEGGRDEVRRVFLRCAEAAMRQVAAAAPEVSHEAGHVASVRFEPLAVFIAAEEEACESLLGVEGDETLLPADGCMLVYGDAGSGKTTLSLDLAAHAAAGMPWLDLLTIPRPLTVAMIENEGSRPRHRLKLRRKSETWEGPPFVERVHIYADPWGEFTFADDRCRESLAAFLNENEVDLLIAGPLVELGASGAGTPDDVSTFSGYIADLRHRLDRRLGLVLIHHENKAGDVSGAWSRLPDTLVQVQELERERTALYFRKARHSSRAHGARVTLAWITESEGFKVVDSDFDDRDTERSQEDAEALAWIVEYAAEQSGLPRGKVEIAYQEAHDGKGRNRARRVIDRQIQLAADPTEATRTGEPILLAVISGENRTGKHVYPADHPCSPLAAPPTGENGEHPDPLDARRSPPPIGIGGEVASTGEHPNGETPNHTPQAHAPSPAAPSCPSQTGSP